MSLLRDAHKNKIIFRAVDLVLPDRLAAIGITEYRIFREGADGIRIEIPPVTDSIRDVLIIGATGTIEFRDPGGEVFLTDKMIQSAAYVYSDGDHQVSIRLNDEGREILARETAEAVGQQISIWLDGELLLSPVVQTAVTDGSIILSGLESETYARGLSGVISGGSLPVVLIQQYVNIFGSSISN